ncbi:MAG TPA: hypothetical protein VI457_14880 [Methylococcaceae bacterium]|nr:hypothetical protein [Methylococcaceae bacterium]
MAALVLALAGSFPAAAQEAQTGGQSLEQAASDPTAALLSVQIQDLFAGDYYQLDDESGNTVLLRSAVPFQFGGMNNIARVTLPLVTDSPSGKSGLGDMTVFDLIVFNAAWGRWGVGPVMLMPTGADGLSTEEWAIGPAVGFTASQPGFLWGLFNQNLFFFAGDGPQDVGVSIIQPIINYSLPDKWSISTSEMNITYDWEKSDWTALPLGVKLAKLIKLGGLPVQFAGSYEYNFADDYVAPEWTFNFTVKLLFPM